MKQSQLFILLLSSLQAYAFENSLERYREREQNVRHGKSKLQSENIILLLQLPAIRLMLRNSLRVKQ